MNVDVRHDEEIGCLVRWVMSRMFRFR